MYHLRKPFYQCTFMWVSLRIGCTPVASNGHKLWGNEALSHQIGCSSIFSQSQVEYIDTSPCNCCQAIYKVPFAGWLQIFALAGAIEARNLANETTKKITDSAVICRRQPSSAGEKLGFPDQLRLPTLLGPDQQA